MFPDIPPAGQRDRQPGNGGQPTSSLRAGASLQGGCGDLSRQRRLCAQGIQVGQGEGGSHRQCHKQEEAVRDTDPDPIALGREGEG